MRLFIAVNLPATEKRRLAELLEHLRVEPIDVRWVDADSLHITLKFLGEVAESLLPRVRSALAQAADGVTPFEMKVAGFGVFPSRNRARVFWIDVAAPAALFGLQKNVEAVIAPLGFPTEKRKFQAHLTLGRVRGQGYVGPEQVHRIAAQVVYNATMRVASVDLMRSHLSPKGARYELLASVPLGNG